MFRRAFLGFAVGLGVTGAHTTLAQRSPADIPSTFGRRHGEVWSESELRAADRTRPVEQFEKRSRVRLLTRDDEEIIIEGSAFEIVNKGARGVTITSVGGAIVTSTPPNVSGFPSRFRRARQRRRLEAHSVEIEISPEGRASFRAVRHPS